MSLKKLSILSPLMLVFACSSEPAPQTGNAVIVDTTNLPKEIDGISFFTTVDCAGAASSLVNQYLATPSSSIDVQKMEKIRSNAISASIERKPANLPVAELNSIIRDQAGSFSDGNRNAVDYLKAQCRALKLDI
ncbi:MAG: hypothetical protein DI586_10515 [Micavibrio aeruginosavorus]|uniref:Lipoprotein n=1 Tax=Micavibrio aeruginosavorus TaxID=349221 RepID=A0A2W5FCZ1_9BACT|nr:MAG: hypothetical protein DI586_10515 [Micavibrio aeruginosavorus]